jgi:hypothetical protein
MRRPIDRSPNHPWVGEMRRITLWMIALLLAANGVAGIVVACAGWQMTTQLLAGLRETSATVAVQQARLVESVNGVAVSVDDAAQATAGVSQSTDRARASVIQATQTSTNLAATFDRLSQASQVTIFGVRPLEGLIQPFTANAQDFRGFSGSLTETADALAANARDMRRVGDDLRGVNDQLKTAASQIEATQMTPLLDQGLASLELGSRLLLTLIFFESLLSALVGLALFILTGRRPLHPHQPLPIVDAPLADEPEIAVKELRARAGGAPLSRA